MPKGQVFDHGYATAAMGYRAISEHMTERGDKMNHSTARNVFLSAMVKLCESISDVLDLKNELKDPISPEAAAKDPRFQCAIESYLREVYNEEI